MHETGCFSQLVLVPRRHQAANDKNLKEFLFSLTGSS